MNPIFRICYQYPLLTERDMDQIASAHKLVNIEKGHLIWKEGKIAHQYYLLEKGLIRSYVYDYEGNEITTAFFSENDIVIIPASLFQRIPSEENLQAITDCVLWQINFDAFQQLFHEIAGFREWGRLWFTNQLFALKQRTLDMVRQTATNRYIKLMQEKPQIVQYAPLKQIASYLGITDTSLSRIRKEITS